MAKLGGIHLDLNLNRSAATGIGGAPITTHLHLPGRVTGAAAHVRGGGVLDQGLKFTGQLPNPPNFKAVNTQASAAASSGHIARVQGLADSMQGAGSRQHRAQLESALFGPRVEQPMRFAQLGSSDAGGDISHAPASELHPPRPRPAVGQTAAAEQSMGFHEFDLSGVSVDARSKWGRWIPDPRVGYEAPSHWSAPSHPQVGGQPATFRAFSAVPIDAGNADQFVSALQRFGAMGNGGPAGSQVLKRLNEADYTSLGNGHAYLEFNHGLRGRSGASTAQLFVFGVEIKHEAIDVLKEKLQARVNE